MPRSPSRLGIAALTCPFLPHVPEPFSPVFSINQQDVYRSIPPERGPFKVPHMHCPLNQHSCQREGPQDPCLLEGNQSRERLSALYRATQTVSQA